jgi:hypothetical protein
MLRNGLSLVFVALIIGCSGQPGQIGPSSMFTGKLTAADGAPLGNVLLTLQPLEIGHPVLLEVDAGGGFQGEGIPGEYAYFVGKPSGAKAVRNVSLSRLPSDFLEPSMNRTIRIGDSPDLQIVLR